MTNDDINTEIPDSGTSTIDIRRQRQTRAEYMENVYNILGEILTNSDDSFQNLFKDSKRIKNGKFLIELNYKKRQLIIRDCAIGMSETRIKEILPVIGSRQSKEGDRGYFGMGLKDCAHLANLVVESIFANRYSRATYEDMDYKIVVKSRKATNEDRTRMKIPTSRGGVSVTVKLLKGVKMPRFEKGFCRDLPNLYGIRHILTDEDMTVTLVEPEKRNRRNIKYTYPKSEKIHEGTIDGCEGAKIAIYRCDKPIEDVTRNKLLRPFARGGFEIRGRRAVHDMTYFNSKIRSEPLHELFLGRIDCSHIDKLIESYDPDPKKRDPDNPQPIIDPRRTGLVQDHPFTALLYDKAAEILWSYIEKELEEQKDNERVIANSKTREQFKKLGKALGKIFKDRLDVVGEELDGESEYRTFMQRNGYAIWPNNTFIAEGQQREFRVYILKKHPNFTIDPGSGRDMILQVKSAFIDTSGDRRSAGRNLQILDGSKVIMREAKDWYVGKFTAFAKKRTDALCIITAKCTSMVGLPDIETQVMIDEPQDYDFNEIVEFGHQSYTIQEGQRRRLKLFVMESALDDDQEDIIVRVKSSDPDAVEVLETPTYARRIRGTNFALANIGIIGQKLYATATIKVSVDATYSTETQVTVVSRSGMQIDIDYVDDDFSPRLAKWKTENDRHKIEIGAKHPTIMRYLGSAADKFPGQNAQGFKEMVADIITNCMAEKLLTEEILKSPSNFDLEGTKSQISEEFYYEHHKRCDAIRKKCHEYLVPTPIIETD